MIYDGVDTDVFQHFLDELALSVVDDPSKRRVLIVDNASWHKSKRLNWHHFEPMYLPAYSPDYNPIERLWLRMKCDWFSDYIAKSREELIEHLCAALTTFMGDPITVASQCANRFQPLFSETTFGRCSKKQTALSGPLTSHRFYRWYLTPQG